MEEPKDQLLMKLRILIEVTAGVGQQILYRAAYLSESELRERIQLLLAAMDGPLEPLRALPVPPTSSPDGLPF